MAFPFTLKILKNLRDSADIGSMAKKLKILLVEDDKRFGESLSKLLEASGFECVYAEKPQTALSFCKIHTFDIAIIDCMLPQMNGVDLAMKVKELFGSSMVLYMMSGIYKDRNFTISALKKTGAKSFLIKPFDLNDLITQLKELDPGSNSEPVLSDNPLKNLILQENLTQNSIYSTLEKLKTINGQELPFIFNFLISYRGSGKLTLKSNDNVLGVIFSDNSFSIPLSTVNGPKLKSLLIAKECVPQDDLQNLKLEDTTIERLISMNLLSPHFADIILKENSLNALHSFSHNMQVEITFQPGKIAPQSLAFSQREIDDIIYNWVLNSEVAWLKTYYLPYNQHTIRKMSTSQNKTQLFPIVSGNKNLLSIMLQNKSLDEILNPATGVKEDVAIQLVHLLMVYREFFIGAKSSNVNYTVQIERLKKLFSAMENQTSFERLGLKETSSDQEIKRAYTEMSQSLHPDKLKDAPPPLVAIATKVYDKIQDAYNNIKTPDKRTEYLSQIEGQKAEKASRANRLLDEATNHLMRGDLSAADAHIQSAAELAPFLPRTKLILTWHQLKTKKINPSDAMRNIMSVPNEDKEGALYLHVRGICHMSLNEFDKASTSFKNAIGKDPNFVAARRELSLISQDDKKQSINILNADLRDVVGLFFNKKKK